MRRRRLVALLVAAGLLLGLALGVVGGVLVGLSTRADDLARLAKDIQQSRVDSVLTSCRELNGRHDNTVAALDAVLSQARKTASASPERLRQIDQLRTSTLLLIEALAPRRDCQARVRALVDLD